MTFLLAMTWTTPVPTILPDTTMRPSVMRLLCPVATKAPSTHKTATCARSNAHLFQSMMPTFPHNSSARARGRPPGKAARMGVKLLRPYASLSPTAAWPVT